MTDRLKRLADWIESIDAIPTNDANLREIAALLRAASAETVGTEWTQHSHPFMSEARGDHNRDLAAARLAVADAKAERDAAINLAYQYPPSEPYNPDGVTWRQMYEMLDEKSLGDKHGHDCAVAALTEQRDAALARVAELERANHSETPKSSPPAATPAATPMTIGEARDLAITQLRTAEAERKAVVAAEAEGPTVIPTYKPWSDVPTHELVARLAECIRATCAEGCTAACLDAIIADARRGCGA